MNKVYVAIDLKSFYGGYAVPRLGGQRTCDKSARPDLPPISMSDRAAQFSPFAALVGYGDAVAETARLTDSRAVLTEDELR